MEDIETQIKQNLEKAQKIMELFADKNINERDQVEDMWYGVPNDVTTNSTPIGPYQEPNQKQYKIRWIFSFPLMDSISRWMARYLK